MPRLLRKTKQFSFSFWRLIIAAAAILLALILINTLLTGVLGLAESVAEQPEKHTVIIFTAPAWCGPCRTLEADRQFQNLLNACRQNPDCDLIIVNGDNPSRLLANGRPYQGTPPSGWPMVIVDGSSFVGDRPEMRQALMKAASCKPPAPPPDSSLVPVPPSRPSPQPQPPSSSQLDDIEKQIKQIQDVMIKTGNALNKWRQEKSPEEMQKLEEQANEMLILANKALELLEAKRGVLKMLEEIKKRMNENPEGSDKWIKTREQAEKILKDINEKLAKLAPPAPPTPAPILPPAPQPQPLPQPQPIPSPGSIMSLEELNQFTRGGNPIPLGQLLRASDGSIWQWNGTDWIRAQ